MSSTHFGKAVVILKLIIVVLILTIVIFRLKILKKYKEFNIDMILKHGVLTEQIFMKGDIFYKGRVKNKDEISHLVYIRLENGEEITVNNIDIFSSLTVGDIATFSKNKYSYKNQQFSFYTLCLGDLENIRLNEEINYLN